MSANEPTDLSDELSPTELAALDELLSTPAVWDDPDVTLEDRVVAAITAAAAATTPGPVTTNPERAATPERRRRRGSERLLTLVGAAAAVTLLVIATVSALRDRSDRSDDQVLALRPPAGAAPLAPGADGEAHIGERGDGTRIRLDVRGLPPAPPGSYYEAWMRKSPQIGVSAGTFHLRGAGRETIELWSGVSPRDYPLFTITIQQEAQPESSGKVLLSGRFA